MCVGFEHGTGTAIEDDCMRQVVRERCHTHLLLDEQTGASESRAKSCGRVFRRFPLLRTESVDRVHGQELEEGGRGRRERCSEQLWLRGRIGDRGSGLAVGRTRFRFLPRPLICTALPCFSLPALSARRPSLLRRCPCASRQRAHTCRIWHAGCGACDGA